MALLPLKMGFAEIRKHAGAADAALNFWYCPEGPDGQPVLLLNKKSISQSDIAEARKGAKSTKHCKGRIHLEDKTLKLRVVGAAPSKIEKGVRQIAADQGMRVSVVEVVENEPDLPDDDATASVGSTGSTGSRGSQDGSGSDSDDDAPDPASQRAQIAAAPAAVSKTQFESALSKAAAAIAAAGKHEQKRLQLRDLVQDMRDKADRERYPDALAVLAKIVALSKQSDNSLARDARRGARAAKVSDQDMQAWAQQDKAWKDSIDLGTYGRGERIGAGGMGAINIMKSTQPGAPPLVLKTGHNLDIEADLYDKVGAHPNIARCLGLQTVGGQQGLVLEAVGGGDMSQALDDMNKLRAAGKLKEEEFWGVMQFSVKRSLEALAFMQEKGLVHRDMKAPNIMFDEETGEPKLIDMGVGGELGKGKGGATPGYVPMGGDEFTDLAKGELKRDTFAMGATAYEVAHGNTGADDAGDKRFFYDRAKDDPSNWMFSAIKWSEDKDNRALKVSDNPDDVFETDTDGNAVKKKAMYGANTGYVDFINWLMHPDPAKRPTPAEALVHPFLQQSLLSDDDAKATVKKLIQGRTAQPAAPADPAQARQDLAGVMRQVALPKLAEDAGKRAAQSSKLAQAIVQRLGKPGDLMGEEVARYQAMADELLGQAEALRQNRDKWTSAAQALTAANAALKADGNKALAKQLADDDKTLRSVSDAARAVQDALDAIGQAVAALQDAVARATPRAKPLWRADDLTLSASSWGAMKKAAIKASLKDEATGMTPALEAVDKLRAAYQKKPTDAKLLAGLKLALDKTEAKLNALKPTSSFGGAHAGMLAYRDKLLAAVATERGNLP